MNGFFDTVRVHMEKRAQYNRTVREIQSMPIDVAHDLGIYRGDAHQIAYNAVYG
ncbi:hypothetical protein [Pacificoceanicola onchidii]|uniref:hypothetical protein n=1 Tax=Pacificoceanicola onchidii TaxID=2562685 RepID=UPI0014560D36|nr:hypothetical protein [Pacificoceanicola onchidii]